MTDFALSISNAAGTVKLVEQAERLVPAAVDEIVVGSYTVQPRGGNSGNMYYSRDGQVLNALGLPNPGMEYLARNAQRLADLQKPVVVSIAGFTFDDYRRLIESVRCYHFRAIELNLGCPNVWDGGRQKRIPSFDPSYIRDVVDMGVDLLARSPTELRVKLSPYSDPSLLAEAASASARADAVVASNTFPNGWLPGAIDIGYGGVSGAAMKAIVLGQIRQFREYLAMPIIGAGGVRCGADLADYEAVGASGVQIGSRFLDAGEDPGVFSDLLLDASA